MTFQKLFGSDNNKATTTNKQVNECYLGLDFYHVNANCINLKYGTYKCKCKPGFEGDGLDCKPVAINDRGQQKVCLGLMDLINMHFLCLAFTFIILYLSHMKNNDYQVIFKTAMSFSFANCQLEMQYFIFIVVFDGTLIFLTYCTQVKSAYS